MDNPVHGHYVSAEGVLFHETTIYAPSGIMQTTYRIYSAIRRGISLSRMSTNNQISPMQLCCYTGFTLL